jgi:hypothetical protein
MVIRATGTAQKPIFRRTAVKMMLIPARRGAAMAARPCLTVTASSTRNHQNQVTAAHLDGQ